MKRARRSSLLAAPLVEVTGLAFVAFYLLAGGTTSDRGSGVILIGTSAWFTVGALVVALRPGNAMGWLFSSIGLLWTSGLASTAWADAGGRSGGAALTFVSWYSEWYWIAALGATLVSMFLFPSGRPLSPRWRIATALTGAVTLIGILGSALQPALSVSSSAPVVDNPIGLAWVGSVVDSPVGQLVSVLIAALAFVGVASIAVRYRAATSDERLRIKWVALAAPIGVLGWVAAALLDSAGVRSDVFWTIPMLAIPCGAGIAILRHRLYDVDRLISRTLVYGSLSAVLALAYVGLVLAGQALFSSFAGGSNLAIAVSTLVVAALFLPLRARVQRIVDRRFYRRRYDAQRTLEAFGSRLREELDLETLSAEMIGVVTETMQPARAAVWLRGPA